MTIDPALMRRNARGRILVLDDDRAVLNMAGEFLRGLGHDVDEVSSLEQARARLKNRNYDLILTDLVLERGTGLELLREVRQTDLPCELLMMTGHGGVDAAIEAIRQGAYDFLTKPLSLSRLQLSLEKALEKLRLERDLQQLTRSRRSSFGGLVGISEPMRQLFSMLERVAPSESNVMLLGESGTGKDVAARAIHDASRRRGKPFVAVHCGAIPPELLESELFGHIKGAFTGADRDRKGLFVAADGGTLFLDELGTAPLRVQVGLLRVLQERTIRPVGSEETHPVDVRVIAATNADLEQEIQAGRFRQDLYYRLATFVVRLPPLRERRDDIPVLANTLLEKVTTRIGKSLSLTPSALAKLVLFDWPGNVRELEHVLEQGAVLARGSAIRDLDLMIDVNAPAPGAIPTLDDLEREHIKAVMELCAGNKQRAAKILGIPRASLYRRLLRHRLEAVEAIAAGEAEGNPKRPSGGIAGIESDAENRPAPPALS